MIQSTLGFPIEGSALNAEVIVENAKIANFNRENALHSPEKGRLSYMPEIVEKVALESGEGEECEAKENVDSAIERMHPRTWRTESNSKIEQTKVEEAAIARGLLVQFHLHHILKTCRFPERGFDVKFIAPPKCCILLWYSPCRARWINNCTHPDLTGDLGLSNVKQHTMVSGGVCGTLPWMAPELLSGKVTW
ncbi:hypothetical protein L1987_29763 [Smallanthus sonchifolius]|uniref:Uncharacterized protein n=1 Tax=Smallanthus sonchifolius TaxID=185202 RepID=A0ACB9I0A7_9ASTR|nr:hypothetical protein L1987_29763 [Smallanthus sonchifolius]